MRKAGRILAKLSAIALAIVGAPSIIQAEEEHSHGPALWKVADEDTTIYLFGTVHALPDGVDWYDERISAAFETSDLLVTEVDMSSMSGAAGDMMNRARLTDGQTLRSLMTDEHRDTYESTLATMGLPAEALDPFEPWYAAMTLTMLPLMQAGYGPDSGVEHILEQRWGPDRQRGALETLDQQIDLFDGLPMDVQLNYLAETVDTVPEMTQVLDAMVDEWLDGDADDLGELLNAEMSDPALYERLLVGRNRHWAEWIDNRMTQPGTVFIAVGAGHLAGAGSVQEQLKARGITVERVD